MKYYLKDLLPRIKKYSAELDQISLITDKPWVISGQGDGFQKLIFRKDNRLHLSINGIVTNGTWEYLAEAKSILIDFGKGDIKLYRHQFMDEAIVAMKLDGSKPSEISDWLLLVNENLVPDLDAERFLQTKYIDGNPSGILLPGKHVQRKFRKNELSESEIEEQLLKFGIIKKGGLFYYDKFKYKDPIDAINYAIISENTRH